MSEAYKQDLIKGVNLDSDETTVERMQAVFIKNLTANQNANPNSASLAGGNKDRYTPLEGNIAIPFTLPSGTNYCVGFYNSEQTNEGYAFVYNSNNHHVIYVLRGDNGAIQTVYEGPLLPFVLSPEFFIAEGRCTLERRSYVDPVTHTETNFKFLIFTTNTDIQYYISVEDSIATSSFTTPSGYFAGAGTLYDPKTLIHLGVPTPLDCIGITPVPVVPDDLEKQNIIVRNAFQFRQKNIDVFGRESIPGIISNQYISIVGGGCISASNGLPRCINLLIDGGNPFVDKIEIYYRKWSGDARGGDLNSGWLKYDTINKWNNVPGLQWYQRVINPNIVYNAGTNKITYTFCGDKGCLPASPTEMALTQPGIPRTSSGVASINKKLMLVNNKRGFQPIDPAMIAKVQFGIEPPDATGNCDAPPIRKVVVYANIFNPYGNYSAIVRSSYTDVVWGNSDNGGGCGAPGYTSSFHLDQVFGDQANPGFIGYMAGMSGSAYACISQQGDFDQTTGAWNFQGFGSGITFPHNPMQRFEMHVPAGKYVFRIAGHKAKITDGDFQQTSTYCAGQCAIYELGGPNRYNYAQYPIKEMIIDCSAGDVILDQLNDNMFVILDLGDGVNSGALDGYLCEQPGGAPIEMAPVLFGAQSGIGTPTDGYGSFFTDHNGFYFCTSGANVTLVKLFVDICDGAGATQVFLGLKGSDGVKHGDGTNTPSGACWAVEGGWRNKVYACDGVNKKFPECGRRRINQRVTLCSNRDAGVPGIPVVLTKGAVSTTDSSGKVAMVAHNKYNYPAVISPMPYLGNLVPTLPGPRAFIYDDLLIFSAKGGCQWTECGTCDPFLGNVAVGYIDCCSPCLSGIATYAVNHGGTGYSIADTFTVNTGTTLATGQVVTVSAGVVTSVKIVKSGAGYGVTSNVATTNVIGTGVGLTINILTIGSCRTINMFDLTVNVIGANISGIQSGGRYPVGFILHDSIGRHTFVQVGELDAGFVNAPNLNDSGYQKFLLSRINFTIGVGCVFPSYFTKMTFAIAENTLFSDFISLPADWIQFVDNTGATNNTNPTGIRIYYGSLNEYNKQNGFSTNLQWQIQSTNDGGQSPVIGDVCQFLMNGDGTWFPSVVSAPITYDNTGKLFFTIEYTNELAALMNGALFRIIRPKVCQNNYIYYEQCFDIDLVAGVPQITSGVLSYADSYILSRQMPVPIMKGQTGAIAPGAYGGAPAIQYTSTNNNPSLVSYADQNNNSNNVVIMDTNDVQTSYPFFFESPSPSDFWGSHLANRGRIFVTNPFEAEQRSGTEVAVSNSLNDRGTLNGLSWFDVGHPDVITFDRNTWGDILVALIEVGRCLFICDCDHFYSDYNSSQLNLQGNNVIATDMYGMFTAPTRPMGTSAGCNPSFINTIRRYMGVVMWLDGSGNLVQSTFGTSKYIEMGYSGYLMNKVALVNIANLTPLTNGTRMFLAGIDPRNGEYLLSTFQFPASGSPSYVNTNSDIVLASNETLIIDLISGVLKSFASFTPEYYGMMPSHYLQANLFTFKNGKAWRHHAGINVAPPYNNFYGTQCKKTFIVVVNPKPERVKRFLFNEVYSSAHKFICTAITTESGQLSRLLDIMWDKRDKFWCSDFKCDLNTYMDPALPPVVIANPLYEGDTLYGRWLRAVYESLAADDAAYTEITSVVNYFIEETNSAE